MKYSELAEKYQELESTQKTLEKTDILAELFKEGGEDLEYLVLLARGRIYPEWNEVEIGLSSSMMQDIIAEATGYTEKEVEELWRDEGDLGLAAEELAKNKKQQKLMSTTLTVEKVIQRLRKVAEMSKEGSSQSVSQDKKKKEIADLISSSEPLEARYITRTVLSHLRIGIGEGTIRDALAEAFFEGENKDKIQRAYDFTNDFTEVAQACTKGIEEVEELKLELFRPVNSMLAKKVDTIEEGFDSVGKPAVIDYKYDGMRAQIHIKDREVKIFTRRLEDVTEQFPDVVEKVEEHIDAENCILDTEIVGFNPEDGSMIEFQKLSKRIKRKYDIQKQVNEIPVEVRPFDLIYLNEPILEEEYSERLEKLDRIVDEEERELRLVDREVTDEEEKVQEMQQKSLSEGHEGIMMKKLDAEYKPGNRVGYMVKLKPVMETLDLAIVAAKWSEGERAGWLGRLFLGCYNKETGEYEQVGKMATGLTEEQLEEITERLKPLIEKEDGRKVWVQPDIIVEVEYEEIQQSPTYNSGYALRFPRLKSFRDDKEEADSKEKIESLYEDQK
ncbi:ATP-dependent DNA ligase [Candidatus Nanohalobium constans]|uniref:DNA ligase n=1 Tax=Candidatus Nanohalobium constans TaxID=2565781 RepID=A0A5Q0UGN3_9ARCH|nr:ATP-dependent DNA ligase [Candidatus Nanohalobium constans]QGA80736.1 DNA ligase 1 [Candidatus Nanohalobium constans]